MTPNEFAPGDKHRATLALARDNFEFFVTIAFRVLNDEPYQHNWHVAAIAHELTRVANGKCRRLIITMPPRTMKTFLASVCLPAWQLGRNPNEKIICASYNQPLANDFAFQMRRLMESSWYREVFPGTMIDPRKSGLEEIRTTRGGYRLSTSVGGTLTGRGGNLVIIDDPIKSGDANSEAVRQSVSQWYSGTVISRFNNPNQGKIVVVAQRLHLRDLPGELAATGGWHQLELPLIAPRAQTIALDDEHEYSRIAGEVLHPARFNPKTIADLKATMGPQDFEAQFNQRPLPPGGAVFRLESLMRYDQKPYDHHIQAIVQSWDTAYEVSGNNDYSVCSTWAICGTDYYLLDVFQKRLTFPELEQAIYKLRTRWRADLVFIEAMGSGSSVYQNIRHNPQNLWIRPVKPQKSKEDRASQQSSKFARGQVWVPREAAWLRRFEDELAEFPHGKHDDQVDSVVQFLAAADMPDLLVLAQMGRQY